MPYVNPSGCVACYIVYNQLSYYFVIIISYRSISNACYMLHVLYIDETEAKKPKEDNASVDKGKVSSYTLLNRYIMCYIINS